MAEETTTTTDTSVAPVVEPVAPITTEAPVTTSLTKEPSLTDVPKFPVTPTEEFDYDKRLYTEDGKFNKDGAKEFFKEQKDKESKYEDRLLKMRQKLSDNNAVEKKEDYFEDFAPEEKYAKFFDPSAPSAPEVKALTDKFAETYHDAGLTRRQADDITKTMLATLESLGVMDTRTEEEKYIAKQKWIQDQKKTLGSNADNIIREARMFLERSDAFDAKTKNHMLELMETQGAPFINTIHALKDAFGEGAGRVPTNISALGGLPSDIQLKQEYLNKDTSPLRRQEIINLRAKAGRTGRLMDSQ